MLLEGLGGLSSLSHVAPQPFHTATVRQRRRSLILDWFQALSYFLGVCLHAFKSCFGATALPLTPNFLEVHNLVRTSCGKWGCARLCLTVYFLRGTRCLNAHTTIPGTRHVGLITGIWWHPDESVISAATYDPFCFHAVGRQSPSLDLFSQQFWPPLC